MKTIGWLLIVMLGGGCAHQAHSTARFTRPEPSRLVLQITRHMDRITHGPDLEEDQELTLTVRDYQLRQKLSIPSANITPQYVARRFGADARGEQFTGYLIIHRVTPDEIAAFLSLTVTARTKGGNYLQTVRFRGDHVFLPTPPP